LNEALSNISSSETEKDFIETNVGHLADGSDEWLLQIFMSEKPKKRRKDQVFRRTGDNWEIARGREEAREGSGLRKYRPKLWNLDFE